MRVSDRQTVTSGTYGYRLQQTISPVQTVRTSPESGPRTRRPSGGPSGGRRPPGAQPGEPPLFSPGSKVYKVQTRYRSGSAIWHNHGQSTPVPGSEEEGGGGGDTVLKAQADPESLQIQYNKSTGLAHQQLQIQRVNAPDSLSESSEIRDSPGDQSSVKRPGGPGCLGVGLTLASVPLALPAAGRLVAGGRAGAPGGRGKACPVSASD